MRLRLKPLTVKAVDASELPSMDQLWDRLPDEPEAVRQWANRLSPKARAVIVAALHEGCIECGHVLVVPEENKPYVCGPCLTKRLDKTKR